MPFTFATLDENLKKLPFFLATIGHDWPQEAIMRTDGYPWYQWIQCISGQGELTLGGVTMEIGPGYGFFLLPDEPHEYRSLSGDWTTDWIGFGGSAVPDMLGFTGIHKSGVYEISDMLRLKTIMREAYTASLDDSAIAFHEMSVLVYELLLALKVALSPRTRDAQPRHNKLRPVLQYIRHHYLENITIDTMAQVLDVSPQYLCQLFKQTLEMRPFEYLTLFRISKTKEIIIENPEISLGDLARLVGFSDSNYLCRVFKKAEGISPGAFKRLHSANQKTDDMKI